MPTQACCQLRYENDPDYDARIRGTYSEGDKIFVPSLAFNIYTGKLQWIHEYRWNAECLFFWGGRFSRWSKDWNRIIDMTEEERERRHTQWHRKSRLSVGPATTAIKPSSIPDKSQ